MITSKLLVMFFPLLDDLEQIAYEAKFEEFTGELDEYDGIHTDLINDTGIVYVQHNPVAGEPSMTVIAEYNGETLKEPSSIDTKEIKESLIGAGEVELNEKIIENMRTEDLQNNQEYLYKK